MSLHPLVLANAHAELDAVIGPDRVPTLDDRPNLPYVEAIMTEVMRYGPPVPGGIPHKTTEDDVYNGYRIAKGTMVMPNLWYVHVFDWSDGIKRFHSGPCCVTKKISLIRLSSPLNDIWKRQSLVGDMFHLNRTRDLSSLGMDEGIWPRNSPSAYQLIYLFSGYALAATSPSYRRGRQLP
jgi:hypothetical protein